MDKSSIKISRAHDLLILPLNMTNMYSLQYFSSSVKIKKETLKSDLWGRFLLYITYYLYSKFSTLYIYQVIVATIQCDGVTCNLCPGGMLWLLECVCDNIALQKLLNRNYSLQYHKLLELFNSEFYYIFPFNF